MKKIIKKIIGAALMLTTAFSAFACSGADKGEEEIGSGTLKASVYTSGVHRLNYTETNEYIVKDSSCGYSIVIPENATERELIAAEELQLFFEEATGIKLPILTDAQAVWSNEAKYFSLGQNEIFKAAGVSLGNDELYTDGFVIKTVGKSVFIAGEHTSAALMGVYGYLELDFHYDCFSPTTYYIDTDVTDLKLKKFDVTDVPDIRQRYNGNDFITLGGLVNYRMRFGADLHGNVLGDVSAASAHTMFSHLPKETHLEKHPKWYSTDGSQICYLARGDNAERDAMLDALLEKFKEYAKAEPNAYIFRLGQEDKVTWCACESCSQSVMEYGCNSAVLVPFANDLAEKVREWFASEEGAPYKRDFYLSFLSYGMSLAPPAKENSDGTWSPIDERMKCDENVIVYYAPLETDFQNSLYAEENEKFLGYFRGWQACSAEMEVFTYQTNFNHFLVPYDCFDQLQEFYQMAAKSNTIFMVDLGQRNQAGATTGWMMLKNYLSSKLAWDTNADVNAYTEKFFTYCYGDAADAMLRWYKEYRVHSRYYHDYLRTDSGGIYTNIKNTAYWPKDTLDHWSGCVDEALSSIEYLKKLDEAKYQSYYDNIALERISLTFLKVELYATRYAEDYIQEIKLSFKEDCNRLGITQYLEGSSATMDVLYQSWGI